MTDESGGGHGHRMSLGDVTVSPDAGGYTIGILKRDGTGFVLSGSHLGWATAVRRAELLARMQQSRVLTSRHGDRFELLDVEAVWLSEHRVWYELTLASIERHAPRTGGLYILRSSTPVFIGDTDHLRDRLLHHLRHPEPREQAAGTLEFSFEETAEADVRARRAGELIAWWAPPCNLPG
jgi:hypothetical protein